MGFTNLTQVAHNLKAEPGQEDQVQAVRRLFEMPSLASSMRRNYKLLPMLAKRQAERRARELVESIATKPLRPDPILSCNPLIRKCQHLVDQVRLHRDCLDPEVRTWGNICEELHRDPEALTCLWALLLDAPELHAVVHTGVSITISECNRRGSHTMPWVE